jgi:hypothetical protein
MAAVTLVEELALEMPKLRKGIIKTLVEVSPFGRRIPLETTGALSVPVTYLSGIPTASLRFINEAAGTQKAAFTQLVENLAIFDTDIDIDPVLLANKNQIQRLDVAETQAKIQAMAYDLVEYAINGDPVTVNARDPRGLKRSLGEEPRFNGQTLNASASAVEAETRVGTATDGNFRTFFHNVNQLLTRVDNKASCLLTNNQMVLTLWAAAQQLKLFATTKDSYDEEIQVYRNAPIIDSGWKSSGAVEGNFAAAGQAGDQIIGNDSEAVTATNGGNLYTNQTPIYAVRFGPEHYMGLQQEALREHVFGETEASPHYFRTNIRWVVHPAAMFQKRAAARLVGHAVSVAPA